MTAASIARALHGRRSGCGWMAQCPAHKDRSPSLSVTERQGKVLVHCHAGCTQDEVIRALRARGLWPEREQQPWTRVERTAWARTKRRTGRDLPTAQLWRRAAVLLGEHTLKELKEALWDPGLPRLGIAEIGWWTRQVTFWRQIEGAELSEEYRWWARHHRRLTAAMVRVLRNLEKAELRALSLYIGITATKAQVTQ